MDFEKLFEQYSIDADGLAASKPYIKSMCIDFYNTAYNQALEDAAKKKKGFWDLEDKGVWATTVEDIDSLKKQ